MKTWKKVATTFTEEMGLLSQIHYGRELTEFSKVSGAYASTNPLNGSVCKEARRKMGTE